MKKVFQFLYVYFFNMFPEKFQQLRNFCVKKYVKSAGENLSIGRFSKIHRNTIIGNNSGVGRACEINNGVTLGNDVMMGPEVVFYTQNHRTDRVDIPLRLQGMRDIVPIVVEDDVWIGARAVILPGVTIGKGSVIGACAVVTKDIPPYSVAVGNPARVIKNRKNVLNKE